MEPTVLRFLAFLGTLALLFVVSMLSVLPIGFFAMKAGQVKGRHILLFQVSLSVVSSLFLSVFLKILTGNGHFLFFLLLLVTSLLLTVLVELIWLFFGTRNVPWAARAMWMGREFQELNPKLHRSITASGATVLLLAYPAYMGFGYFGSAFSSGRWPEHVLQTTLLVFVGAGLLTNGPKQIYALVSRNLAEGSRSRVFISQFASSMTLLLVASLFLRSIDPRAEHVFLGQISLSFAPSVFYAVAGYLALFLLIPYLVGHTRNKEWTISLSETRANIYRSLSSGIRSVNLGTAIDTLEPTRAQVGEQQARLAKDESYALIDGRRSEEAREIAFFRLAAAESAKRDPRFYHASRLAELDAQLDASVVELSAKSDDDGKRAVLERLAAWMDNRKGEHQSKVSEKAWVMVAITAVATGLLSSILTAFSRTFASQLGLDP